MHERQAVGVHLMYLRRQPQESWAEFIGSCLEHGVEIDREVHSESTVNAKEIGV